MTARSAELTPVARAGGNVGSCEESPPQAGTAVGSGESRPLASTAVGSGESLPLASTAWPWLQSAAEMAALLSGYWPVESGIGATGVPATGMRPTGWSSAPLVATRTPAPIPSSVAAARTFTLRTLQRWGTTDCAEDVAAVVSELLTNALRHAIGKPGRCAQASPIRFGLLYPGPCVLCAVADPSNEVPLPRQPDWEAETGRGLQVVASLSHRWGYCPAPDRCGKVVWATVLTSAPNGLAPPG